MMGKKAIFLMILAVSTGAMATDNTDGVCTGQQDKSGQCAPKVHEESEDGEGLSLLQQSVVVQKSRKQEKKDLDHPTEEDEDDKESQIMEEMGEPDAVVDLGDKESLIQLQGSQGKGSGRGSQGFRPTIVKDGDLQACDTFYELSIVICHSYKSYSGKPGEYRIVNAPKYCGSDAISKGLYTVYPEPDKNWVEPKLWWDNNQKLGEPENWTKKPTGAATIKICWHGNPGLVVLMLPTGKEGNDAAWVDKYSIKRPGADFDVGVTGGQGWCWSNEANDGKSWEKSDYTETKKCMKYLLFDFNRAQSEWKNKMYGWEA